MQKCVKKCVKQNRLKMIYFNTWKIKTNLIIRQVVDRGRVVRATKIIEKGIYVCNFDGLVLEPDACKAFLEKA